MLNSYDYDWNDLEDAQLYAEIDYECGQAPMARCSVCGSLYPRVARDSYLRGADDMCNTCFTSVMACSAKPGKRMTFKSDLEDMEYKAQERRRERSIIERQRARAAYSGESGENGASYYPGVPYTSLYAVT